MASNRFRRDASIAAMDAVEPVDVGSRGGGPPPPGMEPGERDTPSTQAIGAFLASVRRRLMLRAALQAVGYGLGILGGVALLLALAAAKIGPASFWPTVAAGVVGAFVVAALIVGVWRPARALRHDRAAARRAGVLLPGLASDLLSAVELAGPIPTDPRAAAVSARLVSAFQDYVAGSVGAVDARGLVPLRPASRALAAAFAALAAVVAAAMLSPTMARGMRTLVH